MSREKDALIQIRLPALLKEALSRRAVSEGVTISSLLRSAIFELVADRLTESEREQLLGEFAPLTKR